MDLKTRHALIPIAVAFVFAAGSIASGLLIAYAVRDRQPALSVLAAPAVLPAASSDAAAAVPREPRSHDAVTSPAPSRLAASAMDDAAPGARAFAGVPGETDRVNDLARSFDRLAARADGGDMIALRTLVDALHVCGAGGHLATRRDGTSGIRHPADQDVRRSDPAAPARRQTPCAGLSAQQLQQRQGWLERLAERGSIEDKLRYVETGAPTLRAGDPGFAAAWSAYRATIRPYLDEAIAAGHVQALIDMARAHRDVFPRDDTQVLAYLHAYALAQGARTDGASAAPPLSLEAARARLTEAQIDRAVALGEDIARRCCLR